jgi:hypothetical protein
MLPETRILGSAAPAGETRSAKTTQTGKVTCQRQFTLSTEGLNRFNGKQGGVHRA